MLNSRSSEVSG